MSLIIKFIFNTTGSKHHYQVHRFIQVRAFRFVQGVFGKVFVGGQAFLLLLNFTLVHTKGALNTLI
jgi:hypothetical protein